MIPDKPSARGAANNRGFTCQVAKQTERRNVSFRASHLSCPMSGLGASLQKILPGLVLRVPLVGGSRRNPNKPRLWAGEFVSW